MVFHDKIGFIGGGKMAEALIKGILKAKLVDPRHVMVVDPDLARREILRDNYAVVATDEAEMVWKECRIIVLAVKPQVMGKLLNGSRDFVTGDHLIISIAAGIPIKFIEENLAGIGCRVIRVMPNTPAIVLEGASALSPGARATSDDMTVAKQIFDAVGTSVVLDELYLDAVTGLSGSGPAYVFTFIESLIDAGLKVGLSQPVARALVLQTVLGATTLAMESGEHPAQLRAMVTSPGGTTIAGLHCLERAGFRGVIMDAVEAATIRSRELAG